MALFKKTNLNPTQKAQKAQTNIAVRVIGAIILVYFIYKLFTQQPFSELVWWQILIGVIMAICAVAIIVLTILEFLHNQKAGFYKADFWNEGGDTGESAPAASDDVKPWNTPEMIEAQSAGESSDTDGEAAADDTETNNSEE
ncbi:MAG: hypothetical protein LBO63_07975 [Oscillospiraceae bacterium]|nr:hypothetical protein [Oscillospiraceae bacterium]